jgi:hypothetical protein
MDTFITVACIAIFFILLKLALDGKLEPTQDWTTINSEGKYERFNRKRERKQ